MTDHKNDGEEEEEEDSKDLEQKQRIEGHQGPRF
jgi:hypothetical protein